MFVVVAGILFFLGIVVILWLQPRPLFDLANRWGPRVEFYKAHAGMRIALTIDDAPSEEWTKKILSVLEAHGVHATFFVMSDEIEGNEEVMQQLVAAGHELGNHTRRDHASIMLSPEEFDEEFSVAQEAISTYMRPTWFRPGVGFYNRHMVKSAAKAGCRSVLGDVFPYDTHVVWPSITASHVLWNVQPGSIIILHDGAARGSRTVDCLSRVLPVLLQRGYTIGTLSELFCDEEVV